MFLVQPFKAAGFGVEAMREGARASAVEADLLAQREAERSDAVLVWKLNPQPGRDPWEGAELHAALGAADVIRRLPRA